MQHCTVGLHRSVCAVSVLSSVCEPVSVSRVGGLEMNRYAVFEESSPEFLSRYSFSPQFTACDTNTLGFMEILFSFNDSKNFEI